MQITLISNVCWAPYWQAYIKTRFSQTSGELQIKTVEYNVYQADIDDVRLADIVVVALNFREFYVDLSNDILSKQITYNEIEENCVHKCRELYSYVKNTGNARVIWFGFEDYCYSQSKNYGCLLLYGGLVDRINLTINEMLEKDAFIDFKRMIATVGLEKSYDMKSLYRWNIPYSKELISLMVDEVYKQQLISYGITKKCLVLDCDNVLWGGILSEDGVEGIKIDSSGLGRPFQDFQRYLIDLFYHGVILAVCSKNDEADVLRVFREHTGMLLKDEHVAVFVCNWDNKPNNIKEISKSLNIGLDSVVFVDDSIFEIESVKVTLPEVTTVLFKKDTVYCELACFNLVRDVSYTAVTERVNTYKTNKFRAALKNSGLSYEDYIASLEMVVDIHRATRTELNRVAELTQRTNKCTNGVRYTLAQIKELYDNNKYELYTVYLSDKFSNLGVVGAIGIQDQSVDLFLLSCRALGRTVEAKMISWLATKAIYDVRFVLNGKNEHLYDFVRKHGMRICVDI
jgi:FkbH-like protein